MNSLYKNSLFWIILAFALVMLFSTVNHKAEPNADVSYSDFLAAVEAKKVKQVTLQGDTILCGAKGGGRTWHREGGGL